VRGNSVNTRKEDVDLRASRGLGVLELPVLTVEGLAPKPGDSAIDFRKSSRGGLVMVLSGVPISQIVERFAEESFEGLFPSGKAGSSCDCF